LTITTGAIDCAGKQQPYFTISRHASPRGGFLFHRVTAP
jgi:hypothetical protein